MKKTLIALAVLAASGASFAQVSITGEYAYGWNTSNSSAGVEKSGLGVDTSFVKFAASEDLGGGLKASAEMSLDGFTRGAANGGDNSLTLEGGFGKIKMANDKGADYLSSVIGGIAGFDGKVYGGRTVNDSVAYTSPAFGGFTFGLSHTENTSAQGLGVGAASNNDQRSNSFTLSYAAGPLAVTGALTSWDNQDTDLNKPDNSKTRARVKGSYDFGAFKLGAGVVQVNRNKGTTTDSILAVTAPFGALTVGFDLANSKRDGSGTAANDVSKNGYGLKAVYSLSKRTSLIGAYTNWDEAGVQRANLTELLVSHTF
ncbi:porin [uncultured Rhodoferax sp.]|uniref:porin n=1 Tax=uncultured Rhodoferax sp. TaxID=223188 RepID=UPI0025EAA101|nr:porin [uncultured Rhodoferax sp.]